MISGHLLYLSNGFIKCNENKCQGIAGKENSYYINSNKIEIQASSSYENLLIHCDKDKKCTLSSGGKNNIYLNGNYEEDKKYLIICNDNKCKTKTGKTETGIESGGEGDKENTINYYINSGHYDSSPLKDSLIKCDKDKCEVYDISSIVTTGGVEEVFYINKNYGKDDNLKYRIF